MLVEIFIVGNDDYWRVIENIKIQLEDLIVNDDYFQVSERLEDYMFIYLFQIILMW